MASTSGGKTSVSKALDEALGTRGATVDSTIIEYIVNVLSDETFEFGEKGENAVEALGEILVESGCVVSEREAYQVCEYLAEKCGRSTSEQQKVRELVRPLKMGAGMPEARVAPKDEGENPGLPLSARDEAKLERRRRREEKQRLAQYHAHMAAAREAMAGMPVVMVAHGGDLGSSGARDIHMDNFSISVAGKELISEATVTLAFGRRYGLVGRNGTGKTTFLKHMAMHAIPGIPKTCQILHVEQEVTGDDATALECVLSADVERTNLLKEEKELIALQQKSALSQSAPPAELAANMANGIKPVNETEKDGGAQTNGEERLSSDAIEERLAAIYKRLEVIDAYSAESRAASILSGLSFAPEMQHRATKTFSGGWRMRIALARALFIEPDLLLLDEPTNHLDLHAVLWLESYLLRWKKTLVVVSHARDFLNTVVTDILHLQNMKMMTYKGDYDTFEKTRQERLKNQQKAFESSERARNHIQALERMGEVEAVINDPDYVFQFPSPDDRPGPPIISFIDASFGYPGGELLFKNLNFGIDLDSRLAVVGSNGIGKSTMLKLISGELEPTSGTVYRSPKVRMAIFNQHHVDGLDLAYTPLQYLSKCFPGVPEQKLRAQLGSFGLGGPLALQPMYTLSGGQKSRVSFAKITYLKPHILLLDEPSNHLDLDAVDALMQGLALYGGGVLMVSHDQHLITGSVDELWVVFNGNVTPFRGTFEDYKRTLVHL
ncbi:hypothetical protein CBR_g19498 [Chara braunii]|uniref:ABC transporter domain-containing protein n=1 Tax=Chara braunii TaxID=69332 RepID=A0A388KY54_CHABU|nr:hypothetical protein CBR_g19498 [Chara braunii]|eukprot:GBG74985.1 hypothetical protein CBR_g19498 [Chara braunii]